MRLEQLEYLISVADNHSMHIASNHLHVSQQNISKAIKQLENELGVELFSRSNRGAALTADGRKVYNHAMAIMEHIIALNHEFNATSHQLDLMGEMVLYLSSGLSVFIDGLIKYLYNAYPLLKLRIIERDTFELLDEITKSQPEILCLQMPIENLSHDPFLRNHYHLYMLHNEPLQIIMSKNSAYANHKAISLKTLSALPLVINSDSSSNLPIYVRILTQQQVKLNIRFVTNSNSSMTNYISSNMAYGLITASTIKALPPHLDFRSIPIKEKIDFAICLLVRHDNHLCAQSQAFINIFKETYVTIYQQIY